MRLAVLLLATVACGRGGAPAPGPVTGQAPSTNASPRIPAGWVEIDPPGEERLQCANYSDDEWQIAVDGDEVRFVKAAQREPDTGPALAFDPAGQKPRGRRHVVAVSDGYLAGYDGGEWGGALYWVAATGPRFTELATENVRGLVSLGDDSAIALEGVAHMMENEGSVRCLQRTAAGWSTKRVDKLDGVPQGFAAAPDAIYAITLDSLVRIRRDGKVETVQPVSTPNLYPDSMAVDATGELWIGMRQLVLRLTPAGGTYSPHWLVEERCRSVTVVKLSCRCDGDVER